MTYIYPPPLAVPSDRTSRSALLAKGPVGRVMATNLAAGIWGLAWSQAGTNEAILMGAMHREIRSTGLLVLLREARANPNGAGIMFAADTVVSVEAGSVSCPVYGEVAVPTSPCSLSTSTQDSACRY